MKTLRFGLAVGVLASLFGASGCNSAQFEFSDAVDLNLDFRLFDHDNDDLNTPYVVGARVDLFVHDTGRRHDTDFTGWSLESADPEVLRIDAVSVLSDDDHSHVSADAVAVSEGVADLLLVDDEGDVVSSVDVPVRFPTHAKLLAAAPVFLDREDVPAETPSPQVLLDGEATFLVRYYDGETRLHGNGALEVDDSEGIAAWVDRSYLFEDRDWLKVRPGEVATHPVELRVGDRPFATVDVHGVGPESVAWVDLHGEDESRADRGDTLLVIAQAYDEDALPIYGVEYSWDLAGHDEPGLGDMFRYEFDPDALSTLRADFEGNRAEAEVRGVDGYVDSSNNVGCNIGGRARAPVWALGLLGLAAFARRRRQA